MTYTEEKERSHRFALALRMGLPIFFFSAVTLFALLTQTETSVGSLLILSIFLLGIIVYFIFYLIYQSTQENITETTTHTFIPEYFFKQLNKAGEKQIQTIMIISVENLWLINEQYGVQNGDITLRDTVMKINRFFNEKGYEKLHVCRYKGGEFLLFFPGRKEKYEPILELFLSKYQNFLENEIEVRLEAAILDTQYTNNVESAVTRLYELYHDRVKEEKEELYSINELEKEIIDALENKRFSLGLWPVCCEREEIYYTTVKLIDSEGRFIHQSRFVPVLNRLNQMRRLESDVLEKIGALCDDLDRQFIISISSVTLRNPHFFEHALTLFERYPSAYRKITLMFEEREYCHQIERFRQQIAHYRKAGYMIGLDRLGGYHTMMLYLKELEIDLARFDTIYSRHIKEEGYQNLIQGLNLSAHLCGVKTWISMIEDEVEDNIAKGLKINYRQGNYLGKILTTEELEGKQNEIR